MNYLHTNPLAPSFMLADRSNKIAFNKLGFRVRLWDVDGLWDESLRCCSNARQVPTQILW